jgi:hypothetical protein
MSHQPEVHSASGNDSLVIPINEPESQPQEIPYGTISPTVKDNTTKIIYLISCLVAFILCFPTIFCDYYYAINNTECLKQPLHINLTMYDYLLTNAILGSSLLIIAFVAILTMKVEELDKQDSLTKFIYYMVKILCSYFTFAWTIVGGIMFWGEMNQGLCSSSTNTYLMVSLIIKFVSIFIDIVSSFSKS